MSIRIMLASVFIFAVAKLIQYFSDNVDHKLILELLSRICASVFIVDILYLIFTFQP